MIQVEGNTHKLEEALRMKDALIEGAASEADASNAQLRQLLEKEREEWANERQGLKSEMEAQAATIEEACVKQRETEAKLGEALAQAFTLHPT